MYRFAAQFVLISPRFFKGTRDLCSVTAMAVSSVGVIQCFLPALRATNEIQAAITISTRVSFFIMDQLCVPSSRSSSLLSSSSISCCSISVCCCDRLLGSIRTTDVPRPLLLLLLSFLWRECVRAWADRLRTMCLSPERAAATMASASGSSERAAAQSRTKKKDVNAYVRT